MSQQGYRQASVRAVTGTSGSYEGDWHALFTLVGLPAGDFDGRLLQYINLKLAASYTSLPEAQQALADSVGAANFGSIGTFTASVSSAPVNTVAPVISGTPTVGQTLSTTDGTWTNSPTSYTYQWQADGSDIGGATANTLVLADAQAGTDITCIVTAHNASGDTPATSNTLGPVALVYLPTVGTAYEAVYATKLLVDGYTGPLFRTVIGGTSTTLDIYPDAQGNPDLSSWNSTYNKIDIIYDQTGNGHDATQTTNARRFNFTTANLLNGQQGWTKDTTNAAAIIPTSLTYARTALTMLSVIASPNTTQNFWLSLGDNASNYLGAGAETTGITSLGSAFRNWNNRGPNAIEPTFCAIVSGSGGSNGRFIVNDDNQTFTAHSAASSSGGLIGAMVTAESTYYSMISEHYCHIIVKAALSLADCNLIRDVLYTRYSITHSYDNIIVADGDSRQLGQQLSTLNVNKWRQIAPQLNERCLVYNIGVNARTMAQCNTNKANVTAKFQAGKNNMCLCNAGGADIDGGSSAATVQTAINSYNTTIKAASSGHLIMENSTPIGGLTAPEQVELTALNASILSDAAAEGYTASDLASLTVAMGDDRHPTSAGYLTEANYEAPLINARL